MEWQFGGELWYWRGPAPWYFVTVPEEVSELIADEATSISCGWGMIPVSVRVGDTRWDTVAVAEERPVHRAGQDASPAGRGCRRR